WRAPRSCRPARPTDRGTRAKTDRRPAARSDRAADSAARCSSCRHMQPAQSREPNKRARAPPTGSLSCRLTRVNVSTRRLDLGAHFRAQLTQRVTVCRGFPHDLGITCGEPCDEPATSAKLHGLGARAYFLGTVFTGGFHLIQKAPDALLS